MMVSELEARIEQARLIDALRAAGKASTDIEDFLEHLVEIFSWSDGDHVEYVGGPGDASVLEAAEIALAFIRLDQGGGHGQD